MTASQAAPLTSLQRTLLALAGPDPDSGLRATLFGLNPMSPVVIRGALRAARDLDCPLAFVASRNQVELPELGGGYVRGWDQQRFAQEVRRLAQEEGCRGPVLVCRDHGGPWQRDDERRAGLSLEEAMQRALRSYLADMEAGFDMLHLDPTVTPAGEVPALGHVLDLSVELLRSLEQERQARGLPPVDYEIGTEETRGTLTDPEQYEAFLRELMTRLEAEGLPRPAFVVGQTGTLIRMCGNVGFDPERARALSAIARRWGVAFKEHNVDYTPEPALRMHPALGIGGGNFGPSMAASESAAYLELDRREQAEAAAGRVAEVSGFGELFRGTVLESGKWRKWWPYDQPAPSNEQVAAHPAVLEEVTVVGGMYVLDDPPVAAARQRMLANLQKSGALEDPEDTAVNAVAERVAGYCRALGLPGTGPAARGEA